MADETAGTVPVRSPQCPECGRKDIRFRPKMNNFLCRVCGHTWARVPAPDNSSAAAP